MNLLRPALLLAFLSAHAAPKIICEQVTHDFGQVPNTTKIQHTFVIRNDGDELLKIERVQPSCGCTVAEISRKELPPGATATLPTVLDLAGKRGPQNKMVTVFSNDPATPHLRLSLTGTASVDIEVNPPFLFIPSVPYGSVSTGAVAVATTGTNLVSVISVQSSSPHVSARFVNKEGGKGADLQVEAKVEEGGPLMTNGRLTIQTDNPRYATLTCDYSFNIIDKISVVPGTMAFSIQAGPNARPPQPVNRIIRVRSGTVKDFKVLEATWPGTGQKGKIVNMGVSGHQVTFENILPAPELNGQAIVLKTDVPGREEVKIPITVTSYGVGIPRGLTQQVPAGTLPAPVPAPAIPPAGVQPVPEAAQPAAK